jgi:predicted nucleic acid-binding protein
MPGSGVVLDTTVVVRYFRDEGALIARFSEFGKLYLPQIALGELYAGAYRSG